MAEEKLTSTQETENSQSEIKPSKKKPSIKTILIAIISFLIILIIVGISILIFSGNSSNEVLEENNIEAMEEEVEHVKEEYFDLSSINSKKLNEELELFTNKNLSTNNKEELTIENENRRILEEQKRIEEESIKIEEEILKKQKEEILATKDELQEEMRKLEDLKKEAIAIKEELLKAQNSVNIEPKQEVSRNPFENIKNTQNEEVIQNVSNSVSNNENINNNFVNLINVAKIKGVLYKKYLDKITLIHKNTILCRDELNRIEIYFGPFEDESLRENLLNELQKSGFTESYLIELTKDEFNKRCNY